MKLRLLSLAGLVAISGAFVIAGCSDDDAVNPGTGGSSSAGKGGSAGHGGGSAGHAGSSKGGSGNPSGGMEEEGGMGPTGGTGPEGGTGPTGGTSSGGKGGSGGATVVGGSGGASGGSGGSAGKGGSGPIGGSGGTAAGGTSAGGASGGSAPTGGSSAGGSGPTGGSGGTGGAAVAGSGGSAVGGSGGAAAGGSGGSGGSAMGGTGGAAAGAGAGGSGGGAPCGGCVVLAAPLSTSSASLSSQTYYSPTDMTNVVITVRACAVTGDANSAFQAWVQNGSGNGYHSNPNAIYARVSTMTLCTAGWQNLTMTVTTGSGPIGAFDATTVEGFVLGVQRYYNSTSPWVDTTVRVDSVTFSSGAPGPYQFATSISPMGAATGVSWLQ